MIDTKIAYEKSINSTTYKFIKEKYLPQIDIREE